MLDAMEKGLRVEDIRAAQPEPEGSRHRRRVLPAVRVSGRNLGRHRSDAAADPRDAADDIGVSVSYPLPGTRFYDRVREELGQKQNWVDSSDLATMYRATFGARGLPAGARPGASRVARPQVRRSPGRVDAGSVARAARGTFAARPPGSITAPRSPSRGGGCGRYRSWRRRKARRTLPPPHHAKSAWRGPGLTGRARASSSTTRARCFSPCRWRWWPSPLRSIDRRSTS